MLLTNKTRLRLQSQNIVFVLLLALVAGLLAWLSQQYYYQADWTAGNRNTLSAASRELLNSLDQPVEITAFIQDDAGLRQRISTRLQRFQRYQPNISLKFVNPDLEPQIAQQAGVRSTGQLVIKLGDRSEVIDDMSEQTIAHALQRLSRPDARWAVFLEGHGERDPFDERNPGLHKLAKTLEKSGIKAQGLNLVRTPAIPDNTSVLVIAAPQTGLLPGEVEQILQYIAAGGHLLWLRDPGDPDSLQPLADQLGVDFIPGMIVDANPQLRVLLGIKHPAVVPIVDYLQHPITRKLKHQTLFPFSTALTTETVKDGAWKTEPLLKTSSRTWSETGDLTGEEVTFNHGDGDTAGPLTLAVALTRVHDNTTQRVIVMGDSDFIANGYLGNGGNLELALNIYNWLCEDEDLLSIVVRRAPDTQLNLSQNETIVIGVGFLVVLPLSLLITGLILWRRRRRR